MLKSGLARSIGFATFLALTAPTGLLPGVALAAEGHGLPLDDVARVLRLLPAKDVTQSGAPPGDQVQAVWTDGAERVRLLVARLPADGATHGGTALTSLLVLTDPRTPGPTLQRQADQAIAALRAHDRGQYRGQPDPGSGSGGRRDPGGASEPLLLALTWTLWALALWALPRALRSAWQTAATEDGTLASRRWPLALGLAVALAVRALAPHRLVMVYFGHVLIDQSATLDVLPRYGPAGATLWHAAFTVLPVAPATVQGVHVALGVLTLLALGAVAARTVPGSAAWTVWATALLPVSILDHGTESILTPAFLCWLCAAILTDRHVRLGGRLDLVAAGVLLGLCGLTRPDCMFLGLPVLAAWLAVLHGPRALWRPGLALLAAGTLVVWLPGMRFLAARTAEAIAMGNLPHFHASALLDVPERMAGDWLALDSRYFPIGWTILALAAGAWLAWRRRPGVLALGALAGAWAIPMLLDFNETSVLRLHAPSGLLVAAAAAAGLASLPWPRWLLGLTAAALLGHAASTAPTVFARQNSNEDDDFLAEVGRIARAGPAATFVTRSFDDPPAFGIHLMQPRYLLGPGDRWSSVRDYERDPQAAHARGEVFLVEGARCRAHRRDGPGAPGPAWIHPACKGFCVRHACQIVAQREVTNRGERGFPWYPPPAELPTLPLVLARLSAQGPPVHSAP